MKWTRCGLLLACLLSIANGVQAAAIHSSADGADETEPFVQAAQLVQPALLSGPHFNVVPEVEIRGYMAHFLIDTSFGPLTADSVQLLAIRVGEIPAIETLERATHSGAFAHALAERGKKTGSAVIKVVTHPVDSIVGLPMGVARYFKKQLDTWTGRAQSVGDRSQRVFENKGDPFRAPDGPMTAQRDAPHASTQADVEHAESFKLQAEDQTANEADTPLSANDSDGAARDKKSRAWYARAGSEVDREAKRYLKYNQARNEMAKYLGIDPNTSNPYVTDRLNSLAWAAVSGNFSAGQALGDITGVAAEVIGDSALIDQFVLTHTPEEVRARNEKNLLSVCSDEFGVRQFSRRGGFNDTLRSQLIASLQKLKPASGCDELLELGATTRGEMEARYLVNALSLILHHAPGATGGKLLVVGAALVYVSPGSTGSGEKLVLPLPLDYLTWSQDIGAFFNRREFIHADKTALIGGEASMLAQRHLTERSWNVVQRAPYDGAPSYARDGEFVRARN